jgi:hypothetical protein
MSELWFDRAAAVAGEKLSRRQAIRRGAGVLGAGVAAGSTAGFLGLLKPGSAPAASGRCDKAPLGRMCAAVCKQTGADMVRFCKHVYKSAPADLQKCLDRNVTQTACFQSCLNNPPVPTRLKNPCPGQVCNPNTGNCEAVKA